MIHCTEQQGSKNGVAEARSEERIIAVNHGQTTAVSRPT